MGFWFHNLKLPDGNGGVIQTRPDHPFGDFPQLKWDQFKDVIPRDLSGRLCLDIGTNSGFYAFQLAERGGRVLGIDLDDHFLNQARFARDLLGWKRHVSLRRMQVYSLAALKRRFDVILFMGVFYHLRYPLLGLDAVVSRLKPGGLLLFQTLTMPGEEALGPEAVKGIGFQERDRLAHPGWPKMAFFEHGFSGDPTNWWAANHAACEAMLRSAGLKILDRPGEEMYLCTTDPDAYTGVPGLRRAEFTAALTGLVSSKSIDT
jgi:tRNA (mo5U34)-methyltransferase